MHNHLPGNNSIVIKDWIHPGLKLDIPKDVPNGIWAVYKVQPCMMVRLHNGR